MEGDLGCAGLPRSRADPLEHSIVAAPRWAHRRHRRGRWALVLLIVGASILRSFLLVTRDLGFEQRVLVRYRRPTSSRRRPARAVRTGPRRRGRASRRRRRGAVDGEPLGSAGVRFTPSVSIPGQPAVSGPEDSGRARVARLVRDLRHTPPGRARFQRPRPCGVGASRDRQRGICEALSQRRAGRSGRPFMDGEGPTDLRPAEIVGLVRDEGSRPFGIRFDRRSTDRLRKRSMKSLLARLPSISLSVRPAGEGPARDPDERVGRLDQRDRLWPLRVISDLSTRHCVRTTFATVCWPSSSGYFGTLALLLAAVGLDGVNGLRDPLSLHGDRHSHGDGRNRLSDRRP